MWFVLIMTLYSIYCDEHGAFACHLTWFSCPQLLCNRQLFSHKPTVHWQADKLATILLTWWHIYELKSQICVGEELWKSIRLIRGNFIPQLFWVNGWYVAVGLFSLFLRFKFFFKYKVNVNICGSNWTKSCLLQNYSSHFKSHFFK